MGVIIFLDIITPLAIIIPIHKKGSKRVCKNYRGFSLLSVPGKVFGKILNDRMRIRTEGKLMEEQVGFRLGRGCTENVFVIRQLGEKMIERGKKLYAAFLDLEKAYDRVCESPSSSDDRKTLPRKWGPCWGRRARTLA